LASLALISQLIMALLKELQLSRLPTAPSFLPDPTGSWELCGDPSHQRIDDSVWASVEIAAECTRRAIKQDDLVGYVGHTGLATGHSPALQMSAAAARPLSFREIGATYSDGCKVGNRCTCRPSRNYRKNARGRYLYGFEVDYRLSRYREKPTHPIFLRDWIGSTSPNRSNCGQLRGKIVQLDFWTYCCINCMHILPD
jgi:hypothetical protein